MKRKPSPAAVTYHRVSTTDQDPTLARDELRRAVALRELALVAEIEEVGSGARNDRPGLARVMALAAAGRVTHVVVWKLDRFGRSALDVLASIQQLNRIGVTFVCTSQQLDVGPRAGAIGRMTMTVLAAVAEFERDLIRERTIAGVARARAKGKRLGRPPVFVDTGRLAKWAARGVPLNKIARRLGVSWATVRSKLSEMGPPLPPPPTADLRHFRDTL